MTSNIKDVARRAGVSTATVSHVINKTRPVSEKTQRKVENAIKGLNYQPNMYARTLRNKQNKEITILVDQAIEQTYTNLALQGIYSLEKYLLQATFQPRICFLQNESLLSEHTQIIIQNKENKRGHDKNKIYLCLHDQVSTKNSNNIYVANEYYHSLLHKIKQEQDTLFLLSFYQGEQIKQLYANDTSLQDIFRSIHVGSSEIESGYQQIKTLITKNPVQKICIADYRLALGAVKLLLFQSNNIINTSQISYYGYSQKLETFDLPIHQQYFSIKPSIDNVLKYIL